MFTSLSAAAALAGFARLLLFSFSMCIVCSLLPVFRLYRPVYCFGVRAQCICRSLHIFFLFSFVDGLFFHVRVVAPELERQAHSCIAHTSCSHTRTRVNNELATHGIRLKCVDTVAALHPFSWQDEPITTINAQNTNKSSPMHRKARAQWWCFAKTRTIYCKTIRKTIIETNVNPLYSFLLFVFCSFFSSVDSFILCEQILVCLERSVLDVSLSMLHCMRNSVTQRRENCSICMRSVRSVIRCRSSLEKEADQCWKQRSRRNAICMCHVDCGWSSYYWL